MPLDLETLERIGLRDIPAWYREKFDVPSLRQGSQNRNNIANIQQDWRNPVTCERRQGKIPEHDRLPNGSLENGTTLSPNSSLTFQQNDNLAAFRHQAPQNTAAVTTHHHRRPELGPFDLERHGQAEYVFRYRHSEAASGRRLTGSFSSGTTNSPQPSSSSFSSGSSPSSDFGFRAPRAPFARKSLIDARSSQVTKTIIHEDADDTLDLLENSLNTIRKLNGLPRGWRDAC
ncbi:hypothetical protein VTN31DRAFT_1583 [Thermomyces dupontii]|uniref:uncharacterized protein n=1 Tax=Talaromyces thermophilus TaxID=28565 RepID=UPI0037440BEB